MKILLIKPPVCGPGDVARYALNKGFFIPPLGLASLTAVLRREGWNVRLLDMFDYSWGDAKECVDAGAPDIVGITAITGTHLIVRDLASLFKRKKNPPVVIIGGPHATHLHEQIAFHYPVDYVVRGEGEDTLREIVQCLSHGGSAEKIPGVTYKKNGTLVVTPDRPLIEDLNALPFPDYSDLDLHRYRPYMDKAGVVPRIVDRDTFALPLLGTRGCPYRCSYCSCPLLWQRTVRYRSPSHIVGEIEAHVQKGVRLFLFSDDIFTLNPERVKIFCAKILEKRLDISWTANGRIPVSDDLLDIMARAGCRRIFYGVESGSSAILKNVNKDTKIDDIHRTIVRTRNWRMSPSVSLMVGNPGETRQSVNQTIKILKDSRPDDIIISSTLVFPGTELENLLKRNGEIPDRIWLTHEYLPFTQSMGEFEQKVQSLRILMWHCFYQKNYAQAFTLFLVRCAQKAIHLFRAQWIIAALRKHPRIETLIEKFI